MAEARSSSQSTPSSLPMDKPNSYPGERMGLPRSGPRSIGRAGRRIAAFAIDIAIGALISYRFFGYDRWASLIIFAVLQIVFLIFASGSVGHLIMGLRVVPIRSGWIGVWRPVVRTVLLSVAVPALIWDKDHRGMHDRIAGTVLVRR
jgi:uncharacterized RDD family membrane protein YckC